LILIHLNGDMRLRALDGSYVARTLNGRAVPADLRLPATGGDFRLFRLEEGVLRLDPTGGFTLHFRYYHQLVRRGKKPVRTPILSDSESGTYRLQAGQLLLTPAKKGGEKTRPAIAASVAGDEIRASYVLEAGTSEERIMLTLRRDPTYW
jgi:hypothetical protein